MPIRPSSALAPVPLNCVCFRWLPPGENDNEAIEQANMRLLAEIQDGGRLYLTHTRLAGTYALRLVPGQTRVERRHVEAAWQIVLASAQAVSQS